MTEFHTLNVVHLTTLISSIGSRKEVIYDGEI